MSAECIYAMITSVLVDGTTERVNGGMETGRASRRRWEIVLVALALLVLAGFFLWSHLPGEAGTAYVSVGGEQILVLPLASAPDQRIDLSVYGVPASLEILDHKIRFVEVICPNHTCEQTGFVWKDGQSAICLPNQTAVVIAG